MNLTFVQHFNAFASIGDTIEARVSLGGYSTGLRLVASLYRDDSPDRPDERDDGFWPSQDQNAAGYCGKMSAVTFAKHKRRAESIMKAWENGEWFYVGVAVRAYFDEEPLTEEFAHALWGVDCNHPQYWWKGRPRGWYPNHYLRDVANELAGECAQEAICHLTELVEIGIEHRGSAE